MRIGLIGFFGWGNFGDELFIEAHRQHLCALGDVVPLNDMTEKPYFSKPISEVVDSVDALVIGGGDLLIPWQLSALYWQMEYLRKPVFVVGVGVPTWNKANPTVIAHYREFLSHPNVKLIQARDPESAAWIRSNIAPDKAVDWYPDLVCAYDLPAVERRQERTFGVVLRQRKAEDDFTHVRALIDRARTYGFKIFHIVLANLATGEKDFDVAKRFQLSDEQLHFSESLDDMCRAIGSCTMIASMKFHGTVVAAMYGVPSIVLSPTDKNRNFMRLIERPDLLSNFSAGNLPDRLPWFPVSIPTHTRAYLRSAATEGYYRLRSAIAASVA